MEKMCLFVFASVFLALSVNAEVHKIRAFRAPINESQLVQVPRKLSMHMPGSGRFAGGYKNLIAGEQPLNDFHGLILTGQVQVGTPGQSLRLGFPFHRNQFWVYGEKASPPRNFVHHRVKKFKESQSSTFKEGELGFSLPYRLATGKYATDVVSVGGQQIELQLGVAQSASFVYGALPVDGEFGIGPNPVDKNGVQSPMNKVFNSLESPLISIWIDKQSLIMEGQSQITFGGLDKDNCNDDWGFVRMTDEGGWHFPLSSVTVGDRTIRSGGDKVRLSDENHLIIGPYSQVRQMLGPIGARLGKIPGTWEIECDKQSTAPDIVFNLDAQKKVQVKISPEVYIVKVPKLSTCMTTFVSYPDPIKSFGWVVGESFYDGRCMAMDWEKRQIGFATTRDY